MSRQIYVISDTHFNHENIIRYCNRPFANAKEMNEAMIENWNSVVKSQDIVYHLGDVFFGKDASHLLKLNGRKRLVLGNHDDAKNQYIVNTFEKIMMWRMFPEFRLLLTHVPVYQNIFDDEHGRDRKGKYDVNVHGHIHDKNVMRLIRGRPVTDDCKHEIDPLYRCVSVEHTNYTPINIEELRVV